ncbi:16S rRNA (guanine(966)-N(2))-methyltransferase RsmD [Demequina capsici]|uniref:16S rRNA (Guanine(966)-N(2))-methyltransferase RsmD n=1 Tax=Demequina capsici TaxID=3075620 RepID=A0AA96F798_9MICO|nr:MULTISPECIES: 16S rRNA (guanine(966)-N(2))-methyltransferase RsmD [unclassified Demequina]WNM25386.1 16S rRNA (guanine(966)-N(2))-methyltransferase RsmD [Demequina sp. OYTSA14]WNM28266.1 16S rRNA (guanine(966)-N(2))-methyltransferase RsmD [Demequina sp. PMTSA13]
MTRIIAGELGGRRVAVPPKGTRPTTDRVREAVFSRLEHAGALRGARVLDLFAGSGALAFEALSRGAADAVLVEAAATAARVAQSNVAELRLQARARVVKERVLPFLTRSQERWDLVLLDPPYDIARADLAGVLEALAPRVAPDGTVVLEWAARAGDAPWPTGLTATGAKAYGETAVHYAEATRAPGERTGSVDA